MKNSKKEEGLDNKNTQINFKVLVGQDELNNDLILDISKLPHLLIGGTSGSGKSNLLHRIVTTLSSQVSPNDLKFILIDSKQIELSIYNNIPHLLTQVINDSKKALMSLKWVIKEMERRFDLFQSENVRNIESYNQKGPKKDSLNDTLPYIMIFIDGLSDLMSEYPKEYGPIMNKLVQKSHLVGIHLVLSTSRAIKKIITEPIISRVGFKVATAIDSKNILGLAGAEKLEPVGEILFQSGNMKYPVCAKLSEISESEIKENVEIIKDRYKEEIITLESLREKDNEEEEDDLYPEARKIVIESGKASTSFIQRKLRIGYARSARLIDMLEDAGVIGKGDGAEPRKVLKKVSDN